MSEVTTEITKSPEVLQSELGSDTKTARRAAMWRKFVNNQTDSPVSAQQNQETDPKRKRWKSKRQQAWEAYISHLGVGPGGEASLEQLVEKAAITDAKIKRDEQLDWEKFIANYQEPKLSFEADETPAPQSDPAESIRTIEDELRVITTKVTFAEGDEKKRLLKEQQELSDLSTLARQEQSGNIAPTYISQHNLLSALVGVVDRVSYKLWKKMSAPYNQYLGLLHSAVQDAREQNARSQGKRIGYLESVRHAWKDRKLTAEELGVQVLELRCSPKYETTLARHVQNLHTH